MITVEQVEEEKQKIVAASKNLEEDVAEFISTLASVQEVIEGVKVAANTYGGHQSADKIARIADMEIDKKSIQSVTDIVAGITVYANPDTKVKIWEK